MRIETICLWEGFNSLSKSAQKRVEQDLRRVIEWENDMREKKNVQPPYGLPRINSSPDIPLTETE